MKHPSFCRGKSCADAAGLTVGVSGRHHTSDKFCSKKCVHSSHGETVSKVTVQQLTMSKLEHCSGPANCCGPGILHIVECITALIKLLRQLKPCDVIVLHNLYKFFNAGLRQALWIIPDTKADQVHWCL